MTETKTIPFLPTLASVYLPVGRYRAELGPLANEGKDDPLSPLDGYLIAQVLGLMDHTFQVIDYAADRCQGMTTVLALSRPEVRRVSLRTPDKAVVSQRPWLKILHDHLNDNPGHFHGTISDGSEAIATDRDGTFVLLDVRSVDVAVTRSLVVSHIESNERTVIACLGTDRLDRCPLLRELLQARDGEQTYQVTLLREVHPSFAASRLALVCTTTAAAAVTRAVDRLARFHATNYSYLEMLNRHFLTAVENAPVDTQSMLRARNLNWLAETNARIASLEKLESGSLLYLLKHKVVRWGKQLAPVGSWQRRVLSRVSRLVGVR